MILDLTLIIRRLVSFEVQHRNDKAGRQSRNVVLGRIYRNLFYRRLSQRRGCIKLRYAPAPALYAEMHHNDCLLFELTDDPDGSPGPQANTLWRPLSPLRTILTEI